MEQFLSNLQKGWHTFTLRDKIENARYKNIFRPSVLSLEYLINKRENRLQLLALAAGGVFITSLILLMYGS